MRADLTLADYIGILSRFYAFYRSVEPTLATTLASAGLAEWFTERGKTARLAQDLGHLAPAELGRPAAPPDSLPPMGTLSQALGCLYVFEGSTLGGQVISRRLRESLAIEPDRGGAFFHGYGARTGERWKEFQALLVERAAPLEHREITDAAGAAFRQLGRWFREAPRTAT